MDGFKKAGGLGEGAPPPPHRLQNKMICQRHDAPLLRQAWMASKKRGGTAAKAGVEGDAAARGAGYLFEWTAVAAQKDYFPHEHRPSCSEASVKEKEKRLKEKEAGAFLDKQYLYEQV